LKFYLAPSRYRDAEQECDKQARERSFPGNGADGRKRLSWLARRGNGLAQSVDRAPSAAETSVIVRDRSVAVSMARSAMPGWVVGSGISIATIPRPRSYDAGSIPVDETATFGYPRERSF